MRTSASTVDRGAEPPTTQSRVMSAPPSELIQSRKAETLPLRSRRTPSRPRPRMRLALTRTPVRGLPVDPLRLRSTSRRESFDGPSWKWFALTGIRRMRIDPAQDRVGATTNQVRAEAHAPTAVLMPATYHAPTAAGMYRNDLARRAWACPPPAVRRQA